MRKPECLEPELKIANALYLLQDVRAQTNSPTWSALAGVLNGIDTNEWNPEIDDRIYRRYSANTLKEGKAANKLAIQKELGLVERADVSILGPLFQAAPQSRAVSTVLDGAVADGFLLLPCHDSRQLPYVFFALKGLCDVLPELPWYPWHLKCVALIRDCSIAAATSCAGASSMKHDGCLISPIECRGCRYALLGG